MKKIILMKMYFILTVMIVVSTLSFTNTVKEAINAMLIICAIILAVIV